MVRWFVTNCLLSNFLKYYHLLRDFSCTFFCIWGMDLNKMVAKSCIIMYFWVLLRFHTFLHMKYCWKLFNRFVQGMKQEGDYIWESFVHKLWILNFLFTFSTIYAFYLQTGTEQYDAIFPSTQASR